MFSNIIRSCQRASFASSESDVLDEQQPATRPQDAPQLAQRARLIVDGAQHERRDRDVETVIVEREIFGWCAQERRVRRALEIRRSRRLAIGCSGSVIVSVRTPPL